jgi:glutaredoxin-like YruB-family protein
MNKEVTVYSTKTCGYCRAVKSFFESKGVEYTEVDVGEDKDKAREMIEKSGQMGVPVVMVKEGDKEEIIVGFDSDKLTEVLGLSE